MFGNHDSEVGMNREDQINLLQAMPYSLVQRGPKDVHGVGNYVLKVYSADPYVHAIFSIGVANRFIQL